MDFKKITSLALVVLLATAIFVFPGCGNKEEEVPPPQPAPAQNPGDTAPAGGTPSSSGELPPPPGMGGK